MYEFVDQIFVRLGRVIQDAADAVGSPLLSTVTQVLLVALPLTVVFPLIFALSTWAERKLLGRIQNRLGPNRVGPFGLFQPVADGIKTLTKEDIVPARADHTLHTLAPILAVIPAFMVLSVLPVGRNMTPTELGIGLLFFFAAGSISEMAVFMAGWASRNKYSLLGGMRAIAQMISYEIPFILSALTVIMVTGTLSTTQIVEAQALQLSVGNPAGIGGWFLRAGCHLANNVGGWHVFQPWGFFGFLIYFTAGLAESNRSPFDIPEAESEIIAGHHTEYSGFKFALFAMAEYIGMIAICGLGATLFLGGWQGPKPIPSWAWFFLKTFALMFSMVWIRGTFPRARVDQLMAFAWKFLLPLALINLLAAGLSIYVPSRPIGWIAGALLMTTAYLALARSLTGPALHTRTYHYA